MPAIESMPLRISLNTSRGCVYSQSQPDPARELLDDPEVLARLARRLDRLAAELHHAVGVGHGADLLRPGGRRQHDVGEIRGLGEEDVLHDQVIERGERLARVIDVGVGHRRVLAHDVHAADLALLRGVHDLDHGEAGLRIELLPPERLEARASPPGCRRADSPDRPSESGRSRRRPARCSGRAADAARSPAGRSGRWRARARSGSARCRCRGCAARSPCPTGSSSPSRSRRGAPPRGSSRRGCRRSAPSSPANTSSRSRASAS